MEDIEDMDFQSISLSDGEEPPLKKIKRDTTLSKSTQLSSHMAKSTLSPILDLKLGNRTIQRTENKMSLLDIAATMLTLSQIPENQHSADIIKQSPVKKVKFRKPLPISRSNMNIENEDREIFSPMSAPKEHTLIKSLKPMSGVKLDEVQHRIASYQNYLAIQLKAAPRMSFFKLRNIEAEPNINRIRMHLELTKFMIKWLDQIDKLNKYCTDKYQDLIDMEMRFNQLETIVEEKRNILSKLLEYETSAYDSPYYRIELLNRFLKDKKMQLDDAFIMFRQTRTVCINESINVTAYPFEEKLFEDHKGLLTLINNQILFFNNTASKLVTYCAFIVFSIYECSNRVVEDFKDILVVNVAKNDFNIFSII